MSKLMAAVDIDGNREVSEEQSAQTLFYRYLDDSFQHVYRGRWI